MPPLITLKVDLRDVKRAFAELKSEAPKAIMRALNKTAKSVRTQAVREIGRDLGIAQKRIRENVTVDSAYPGHLISAVTAKPGGSGVSAAKGKRERQGRIPLYEFKARALKRGGVRYTLPTGKGTLPHAFIATMQSGHKGVFGRLAGTQMGKRGRGVLSKAGKLWKREKITELFGPSIPRVFANRAVLRALRENGAALLKKNLAHETEFLLRRHR